MTGFRFVPSAEASQEPNVVVDGGANDNTVLTLSHWPGSDSPVEFAADLSAEMAFKFMAAPDRWPDCRVVTNDHFDQDGLVSVYALCEPAAAADSKEFLLDVAAAGDFATFESRPAARVSMTLGAFADPDRSSFDLDSNYSVRCAHLYLECLAVLPDLLADPDRFREHWEAEDACLTKSFELLQDPTSSVVMVDDVHLAVLRVPDRASGLWGHRFGGDRFDRIHPMALHCLTSSPRILLSQGQRHRYVDRYETWVQYRSRPLPLRVDLRPLAEQLNGLEPGPCRWRADPPGALTPFLETVGTDRSDLDPKLVAETIAGHLRTAPSAWDPFASDPALGAG